MKPFAIVISIVIVVACLIYGLTFVKIDSNNIDQTAQAELSAQDNLTVSSSLSRVVLSVDPNASQLTAHLYGDAWGMNLGGDPQLITDRSGSAVTVRAQRPRLGGGFLGMNRLTLEVTLPASFAGKLEVQASAGSIVVQSDLNVQSLTAHSSSGSVSVMNVTAQGSVEVSSSAGSVETGDVRAQSANIHSSAGRVVVKTCEAEKIRLNSSAGSVRAEGLKGRVDANSSAGRVDVTLLAVTDDVRVNSSAGRAIVMLPANANARINAHSSAGSVEVSGLDMNTSLQKKDHVEGTLGSGGPMVEVSSSAGGVQVVGK